MGSHKAHPFSFSLSTTSSRRDGQQLAHPLDQLLDVERLLHELVRAGLIWLLTNDSSGASIIEDLSYDAHVGSYDVAVYDLAGPNDVVQGSVQADLAGLLAEGAADPERIAAQLLPATVRGDAWAVSALRDAARSAVARAPAIAASVSWLGGSVTAPPA